MMTDDRSVQSDRRQLVQFHFDRLGLGDVGAWIRARRVENMSWGHMSRVLWDLIDIDVSYETLRRWHQDDETREEHGSNTG